MAYAKWLAQREVDRKNTWSNHCLCINHWAEWDSKTCIETEPWRKVAPYLVLLGERGQDFIIRLILEKEHRGKTTRVKEK